jgi:predicted Zn-dependent peptidase
MPLGTVEPQLTTLSNGVRIVAIRLPNAHRVVIDSRVRVGPRYETRRTNGISHFLEHMLYRGTPAYPTAHKLSLAIEGLGGTLEAATYADQGELILSTPPEHLDALIDIYADVYQHPKLTALKVERGIVHEEILECLDDEGRQVDADVLVRALCFGDQGLGLPITGETKHLDYYTTETLRAHHARHYIGRETVIAIAGNIDVDWATRKLEGAFGGLRKGRARKLTAPMPQDEARFRYVHNVSSQTSLRFGLRGPGVRDDLEPATELVLRTLDDGMSTRLYARICDQLGLCYDVSAGYEGYDDVGLVTIALEAQHEQVERLVDEVFMILQRLKNDGPSDEELRKAKERHHWQLIELLEAPQDVAEYFAVGEFSDVSRTLEERRDTIENCTRAEVMEAARRLFSASALNVMAVGTISPETRERIANKVKLFV